MTKIPMKPKNDQNTQNPKNYQNTPENPNIQMGWIKTYPNYVGNGWVYEYG